MRPDGSVLGTIGGGAVEHLAVQEAKALWAHGGGPVRRHYDLTPARPSWAWCAGATLTWNLRCANERDHPVSSEQLSPLQAGPPASGGAAGGASRVAGHPPPNGRRGGGARLCRYL
ncbi:XdhC family protein [Flavonifractor plautii]|nr:XdhC family protein [Flavonifractor plautii]